MTPEAQRIAIAEACGTLGMCGEIWHFDEYERRHIYHDKNQFVPDYLNDLNAMHEAEKVLTYEQHCEMADMLENSFIISGPAQWKCCFATAARRAEAFLRTLGLWKD